MTAVADPAAIFKAYDVRGLVPEELDEAAARAIGRAFTHEVAQNAGPTRVVVGHDMRPSSPRLSSAFADGARAAGADVTDIGLASTDELYFASGQLGMAGAMVTASHNPAAYNGIKLCRSGAVAIGLDSGLATIRDRVGNSEDLEASSEACSAPQRRGSIRHLDVLPAYADHLRRLAPVTGRRLKVVVDAANGMAGHTVPAVFAELDVELVSLYFELDGTFPHHEANPLDPANLRDLQAAVISSRADLGLAFDGDADRCFAVDERGAPMSPSTVTGLISARELAREPGAAVVHNLITSRAVPELVRRLGGVPVRTRVGHSFIKAVMAERDAVFGGEHSGHFYFRDFWYADSGLLAALHLLAALAGDARPASQLVAEFHPYVASGEINSAVNRPAEALACLEAAYASRPGTALDHLDGLTVTASAWWFNVRLSNTEPLLRLNVEADNSATMEAVRDEVLGMIRRDR
jgi:phosphomannomutase